MVDWFEIRNSTFDIGPSPDDGRKFTELYNGAVGDGATWTLDPQGSRAGERVINVQHLQSAQLDRVSRVCISTIQRLYSMLRTFFFRIETRMPQHQFTRGDRQRVMRIQRTVWNALSPTPA
jgi:hypothetical protein